MSPAFRTEESLDIVPVNRRTAIKPEVVTDWREPPEIAEAHRSDRDLLKAPASHTLYET